MEYKMRRHKQQLTAQVAAAILESATNGILSLVDADGEPYGVPLSYACDDNGHIYFHSAARGHKIDSVGSGAPCSFCVVDRDAVVPDEFTTYFRSVIVKGKIHIMDDYDEIHKGLLLLCAKYSPGIDPAREIAKCIGHVKVLRLDISQITGKQAIELVNRHN